RIHYDLAVLQQGNSCPPSGGGTADAGPGSSGSGDAGPMCGSCRDCLNQACSNGKCSSCISSADCCSPLVCGVDGVCAPTPPQ
ncbi:MAG: hypothetical protein ACREJ3_19560, partial [Polyangiaceae bacterium]